MTTFRRSITTSKRVAVSAALAGALALAGCATPRGIDSQALMVQARADREQAQRDVEPIVGDLSLEEALDRALKYNLDRRVRMLEEAIALRQLDVTRLDMLPTLLAQAGYRSRNNDVTRLSRDANGNLVPSQFISQERSHTLVELGTSWSLLDFGMGYYASRQQVNRYLVAAEKRRKATHLLMQDVRVAFWRAASAQKMQDRVIATIALAERAMDDARKVEESRIRNPVDILRYQRQLLENLRLLEAIAQELSAAQIELASLINAPLTETLRVVEPADAGIKPQLLQMTAADMEEFAMANNADIREQQYNSRDAAIEARKTLLRMFPNLSFDYSLNYDTDNFLINDRWNQTGLQLSLNLLRLLTYPKEKRLAEAGVTLATQRRIAAQAAVLAQVHISRLQLANAVLQLSRANQIHEADQRLAVIVESRETAQLQSKLDRISSDTAALLSELRRYQALSTAQLAQARLEATLGAEVQSGGSQ